MQHCNNSSQQQQQQMMSDSQTKLCSHMWVDDAFFHRALQELESNIDGWRQVRRSRLITLYRKSLSFEPERRTETTHLAFRAEFVLPMSLRDSFLVNHDFDLWRRNSRFVGDLHHVHPPTEDCTSDVYYGNTRSPMRWIVSDRDFVVARRWQFDAERGRIVIVSRHHEDDEGRYPPREGYIRARVLLHAASFEAVDGGHGTKVTILTSVDLGGWLSMKAVNWMLKLCSDEIVQGLISSGRELDDQQRHELLERWPLLREMGARS